MTVNAGGQVIEVALDLKQDGAGFSGTTSSVLGIGTIAKGNVSGTNMTAVFAAEIQGQPMELQLEGKIDGDKMSGTVSGPGLPAMAFTAAKAP